MFLLHIFFILMRCIYIFFLLFSYSFIKDSFKFQKFFIMGGGLIQLTAYGAQDIFLTGNPQITFFKAVYRRHTNFSIEQVRQEFKNTVDFGNKVTCTISKQGDLLHRLLLQIDLPSVSLSSTARANRFRWLNWIGHTLIKSVEIEIGGKKIDKHYGDWFHIGTH